MTEQNANRDSSRQPGRETSGSDSGPGNRPGRKGRRRYFQPKKDGKPQAAGQASGQSANQPAGQSSGQPNQSSQSQRGQENGRRGDGKRGASGRRGDEGRKARRRARSRQRYDDSRAANLEAEVAYVAPQSVYIYEHSVHPELRDSYEFRPDHFSKVGRTLDDYQIDLSKLFPGEIADDGTPVLTNMLPKPQFDWTGWEEEGPEPLPAAGEAEQKG